MDQDNIKDLKRRAGITEERGFIDSVMQKIQGGAGPDDVAPMIAKIAGGDPTKASRMTMELVTYMLGFPGLWAKFYHNYPKAK